MAKVNLSSTTVDSSSNLPVAELSTLSPISTLHHDILWKIFLINSNVQEPYRYAHDQRTLEEREKEQYHCNPLTTARRTSHVCRRWRNIILSSSSLWGRLIDINILSQAQPSWKETVFLRSGQSPLHIKGEVFGLEAQTLFISLLQTRWLQIQKIDVRGEGGEWLDLTLMSFPTTILESFQLRLGQPEATFSPPETGIKDTSSVFANSAPHLQEFCCTQLDIRLDVSWLSQLRRLGFFYSGSSPFTFAELIAALENTPLLESLAIRWEFMPSDEERHKTIKPIHLPRLQELGIMASVHAASALMGHITPCLGCALYVSAYDTAVSRHKVHDMSNEIARYAQGYLNHSRKPVKYLYISVQRTNLTISERPRISDIDSPTFHFSIFYRWIHGLVALLFFFPPFASCDLSRVTTLEFTVVPELDIRYKKIGIRTGEDDQVLTFILSFAAVEELITTQETLDYLLRQADKASSLFPSLNTIKLIPSYDGNEDRRSAAAAAKGQHPAIPFLVARRDAGKPIRHLDFSLWRREMRNLESLYSIDGLKVTSKI